MIHLEKDLDYRQFVLSKVCPKPRPSLCLGAALLAAQDRYLPLSSSLIGYSEQFSPSFFNLLRRTIRRQLW